MSISARRNIKRPDLVGRLRKHAREQWRAWSAKNHRERKSVERSLPKLKPETEEVIAKSFAEEQKQAHKRRDAHIAGCDELLRLLKLHHPERDRVAA